jgi:di/tricarboxylate transporter
VVLDGVATSYCGAVSDSAISFTVLGVAVVLFVWNKLPVEVVALGVALSLWATGVLTIEQSVGGFGDPTVLFIAALFVVSEGLDATGVTAWAGQRLVARAGTSHARLLTLTMLLAAGFTALISVNGAVAALVPMVVVLAVRVHMPPSQVMMPLAFAAHAGSMLALTGTPVSVIVSDAAADAGEGRFGFFSFSLVGVPLVIGSIVIVVLLGSRLLPHRTPQSLPADLSNLALSLSNQYDIVPAGTDEPLIDRTHGLAELVVPPRSSLIGEQVFPGMVSDDGNLIILGLQRKGEDVGTKGIQLQAGDVLLVRGQWADLAARAAAPDVMVVDQPDLVRRQAVPLGAGAKRAIGVLVVMVVLLATGVMPAVAAGLLAAMTLIVTRVLTMEQAYRSISWTTVVLVGGMTPLSVAMRETGAAETLADGLITIVGDAGPYALVAGLFVLTAVLGQLISNMATALIVIPIAVSAAAEMDVSARPVLMAVNVAAAAAFLTPVATPANLMVMGPGGYKFGDYGKLGGCLIALFFLVATFWVPTVWSF